MRPGDTVKGVIRKPKDNEKYFALLKVDQVNGEDPLKMADRPNFDRLAALHPDEKFNLECDPDIISTRVIDIFSPIGKGQRGLIVAPPKAGKTVLLKDIAKILEETKKIQRLPVVNFAAGGIATPSDAAIMMQLGSDGVFVGSGIFKSGNPKKRAKAIVQAVTHYNKPDIIADISKNIGDAMIGLDIDDIPKEQRLQERGW